MPVCDSGLDSLNPTLHKTTHTNHPHINIIMGYSTDFSGSFKLDQPLTAAQAAYLNAFSSTRRMGRNVSVLANRPDPIREAVGLPLGPEGAYFVATDEFGHPSITNYNQPPQGQPGLWCKWEATDNGNSIEWNLAEKFYDYIEWLEYLIEHFLTPWGRTLNGEVEWFGDDPNDRGRIIVKDNRVTTKKARVVYD